MMMIKYGTICLVISFVKVVGFGRFSEAQKLYSNRLIIYIYRERGEGDIIAGSSVDFEARERRCIIFLVFIALF